MSRSRIIEWAADKLDWLKTLLGNAWEHYKDFSRHPSYRKVVNAKLDWLMATRCDDFKGIHADIGGVCRRFDALEKQLNKLGTDAEWMGRVIAKLDAIQGALLHEQFVKGHEEVIYDPIANTLNVKASGGKSKTKASVPVNLTPSRPRKLQKESHIAERAVGGRGLIGSSRKTQ